MSLLSQEKNLLTFANQESVFLAATVILGITYPNLIVIVVSRLHFYIT